MVPLAASGSSVQSILERLDPDQLFGLMCTSVAVGSAATVLIVWCVAGSLRRVWQIKLRTQFVSELSARGHSTNEILEIARLTFQQPLRRRSRRSERREARLLAKRARREARHHKPIYEKPVLQKPLPPQSVLKA